MAGPAILKIDIIADATKASAALKDTGGAAQSTGSKFGALGKAVAGGVAVGAVIQFGKASVEAATESAVATKRLDQVFSAMGDTTGKASKAAQDYASSLSKKIGVDDDSIMAAQAQLATFSAVSDETARAAGIFDRTTAAAADLAAAGFGTLDSNSVQLGKALQDPVKGLAALSKSGVTFTEAQKEQIAAMVESGDLLGAQKVVLKAVEGQVKGTAAATATSADKMNVAWGESQEAVGNALLPVLEKLLPILTTLAGFIERNISWILPLAAAIGVLALAWNIASIAATLFGVSMLSALWPVLLVIAAIAALIAIGIVVVKNWDTIKAAALAVWSSIASAFTSAKNTIVGAWNAILDVIQGVLSWVRANWPTLLAILTGPIGVAVLLITKNWDTIKEAASALYDWVRGKFQALADFISGLVSGIAHTASSIANAIKGPINTVLRAWNALEFKVPEVKVGPVTFGGQTIGLPDIPLLATGGSVLRTGLAIVHAGETFSGVGRTFGSSTVVNVNVTTTGLGADAPEVQRAVVNAMRGYVSRNGPLDVPVRSTGAI